MNKHKRPKTEVKNYKDYLREAMDRDAYYQNYKEYCDSKEVNTSFKLIK